LPPKSAPICPTWKRSRRSGSFRANDFLEFVLTDAGTSGRPFTTSELLGRAEKFIQAGNGAADNRVAIEQLINLGVLFAGLGQNRKALQLTELAHARAIQANYPDLRLRSACELGRQLHYAGRLGESTALLAETIAELERQAPDSPALIDCLMHESDLELTKQNPPAGIDLAQQSVEQAHRLFPRSRAGSRYPVSHRTGWGTGCWPRPRWSEPWAILARRERSRSRRARNLRRPWGRVTP
jgi:hypothetical protein